MRLSRRRRLPRRRQWAVPLLHGALRDQSVLCGGRRRHRGGLQSGGGVPEPMAGYLPLCPHGVQLHAVCQGPGRSGGARWDASFSMTPLPLRDVSERLTTAGGAPLDPPPLPLFEAKFSSAPLAQEVLSFRVGGTIGGGGDPAKPPPPLPIYPSPPSNPPPPLFQYISPLPLIPHPPFPSSNTSLAPPPLCSNTPPPLPTIHSLCAKDN